MRKLSGLRRSWGGGGLTESVCHSDGWGKQNSNFVQTQNIIRKQNLCSVLNVAWLWNRNIYKCEAQSVFLGGSRIAKFWGCKMEQDILWGVKKNKKKWTATVYVLKQKVLWSENIVPIFGDQFELPCMKETEHPGCRKNFSFFFKTMVVWTLRGATSRRTSSVTRRPSGRYLPTLTTTTNKNNWNCCSQKLE